MKSKPVIREQETARCQEKCMKFDLKNFSKESEIKDINGIDE